MISPNPDATIAEVFDADEAGARLVLAMGMAKNDIDRARRDADEAGRQNRPDFSYRVRLMIGHLVEGLDSLSAYTSEFEEARKLTKRVSREGQHMLATTRGTPQQVGPKVLEHARHNTFHYPSPKARYGAATNSDAQLRDALAANGSEPAGIHIDFATKHVTLTFAEQAALALALGKHATDLDEAREQFIRTRDGADAFVARAERLLIAYFEATGAAF
jgi:hypothetical protein